MFYDKEKWKEEQNEKVNKLENQINQIVKNYKENPEEFLELLNFSKNFKNYSLRNTILIKEQQPHAMFVASFLEFKKMGYFVKQGEEAIKIFIPVTTKYVVLNNKFKLYKELTEEEKSIVKEEKIEVQHKLGFKLGNVFDISQTTIPVEDIPKIFNYTSDVEYDVKDKLKIIEDYIKENNINLEYKSLPLASYGFYNLEQNKIVINEKLDDVNKLSTLMHELGHQILHNNINEVKELSTEIIEVQADCVDILMSNHFEIDIPRKSQNHLTDNIRKIDEKDLKKYIIPVVDKTNKLINKLDLQKNNEIKKGIDLSNDQKDKEVIENEKIR